MIEDDHSDKRLNYINMTLVLVKGLCCGMIDNNRSSTFKAHGHSTSWDIINDRNTEYNILTVHYLIVAKGNIAC